MTRIPELPEHAPVFPLPGVVLLPRSRLPLHIFEPRYLQMLDDVLRSPERLIVMAQPRGIPGNDTQAVQKIGCAGRVTQFSETEDGRYMITLTGISRCRIGQEITGFTPYRRFELDWVGFDRDQSGPEHDPGFDRVAFLELLERYFESQKLSVEWDTLKEADDELLLNSLSMLLEFSPEEKQALLEAPSLSTRRETLVTLLEYSLRGGKPEDLLQ